MVLWIKSNERATIIKLTVQFLSYLFYVRLGHHSEVISIFNVLNI